MGLAARLPLHSRKVHNRLRGMFECFCLFHLIFGKVPSSSPSQLMSKDRSGFGLPNPFLYSQALLDQHHHHHRTFANNNVALEVNPVAVRELEHGEEPRLRCSRHPVVPGEVDGED